MKGSHKEGPITLIDSHVTQVAGTDAAPINTVELGPEGHIALRTEPPARVLGFLLKAILLEQSCHVLPCVAMLWL